MWQYIFLLDFVGIDLENIVYYKDDTHYFVMTAKKQSLLEKGVILHVSDQSPVLSPMCVCVFDRQLLNLILCLCSRHKGYAVSTHRQHQKSVALFSLSFCQVSH